MTNHDWGRGREPADEPMFRLARPLVVIIGLMAAVSVARAVIPPETDELVLLDFAFIPARYLLADGEPVYPGGWGAMGWTFLTHALLHSGWVHLMVNAAMLAAIGERVLARLGLARFLALTAVATAAGAAVHLMVAFGSPAPMLGASGAVSGLFGALLRFWSRPAWVASASIGESLAEPRVRGILTALVIINVVMAVAGSAPFGGDGGGVAWGAHLGGFLVGFLGFSAFERPRRRR